MDIDELRREAEEGKERLRRDIFEFQDLLRRMAEEVKEIRGNRAEASICRAERRIGEIVQQVESRVDKAISVMIGASTGRRNVVTREIDLVTSPISRSAVVLRSVLRKRIHTASA